MNLCKNCGIETSNIKFCSRSCSASFTNRKKPKRKPEGSCDLCNKTITTSRKYCSECHTKKSLSNKTIHEVLYGGKGHRSNRYGYVRWHARKAIADRTKKCEKCGYDNHVEICHIKPIKDFDPCSLLSEVNSPENLLLLCPNCHWEFDNPRPTRVS